MQNFNKNKNKMPKRNFFQRITYLESKPVPYLIRFHRLYKKYLKVADLTVLQRLGVTELQ